MGRNILKISFLTAACLVLANCGKKNFSSNTAASQAVNAAQSTDNTGVTTPPNTNPPMTTPPTTTPPSTDLRGQDACVSTVEWYDGFNWIPYVSDADCISKMRALISADSGTMLDFEIRHLTKAQLNDFSARSADTAAFVALFKAQTTPIYSFNDGWLNDN